MFWTQIFDLVMGIGAVIIQASIVTTAGLFFFGKHTKLYRWIIEKKYILVFLLALLATLGSLFYSEIIGIAPCRYCWWQRVFIYPQVLIAGIALWKKETAAVGKYLMGLSIIGIGFALYHYLVQKISVVAETTNCAVEGVSCAGSYMNVFGYITIPMMSLTILIGILLLLWLPKKETSLS